MPQVATPTFNPTGGKVAVGTDDSPVRFTIACDTVDATIYYTYGDAPANTGWTEYEEGGVVLPTTSGSVVDVRSYATLDGSSDSSVASANYDMTGTSSAVSESYPAVYDSADSQATGAVCEGIGLTGSDQDSISGWRIGASSTTTDLKIEYTS